MKLYAVKEDPNVINEVQVGVHHMGKSRTKKEKSIISITPFVDGTLLFLSSRLLRNAVLMFFRSCGICEYSIREIECCERTKDRLLQNCYCILRTIS